MHKRIFLLCCLLFLLCTGCAKTPSVPPAKQELIQAAPSTKESSTPAEETAANIYLQDYDQLWEDLLQNYPFFPALEDRGIAIHEVRIQYRLLAEQATSTEEFMVVLDKLFGKLQCVAHLSLIHRDRYEILTETMAGLRDEMWQPWQTILLAEQTAACYRALPEYTGNFSAPVQKIETAYYPELAAAYFRFPSMTPRAEDTDQTLIADYLAALPDVQHIIIDVTGNSGGSTAYWESAIVKPFGGSYTATYPVYYQDTPMVHAYYGNRISTQLSSMDSLPVFAEAYQIAAYEEREMQVSGTPTVPENARQAKRWVLIDEGCYSATDQFAAFCKLTGWATLVGNQSGGDGLGGQPVLLPLKNTGLLVYFSLALAPNPDGTLNAIGGIAPDYSCLVKENLSPLETCIRLIRAEPAPN